MLSLLFSVIFGLAIGYFATQNTSPVTIQLGELRVENVPLYFATIGSLILGLFIAWIFYFARTVSSTFTIYGKDHLAKRTETAADLEQRIRQLESENTRLKGNAVSGEYPAGLASTYKCFYNHDCSSPILPSGSMAWRHVTRAPADVFRETTAPIEPTQPNIAAYFRVPFDFFRRPHAPVDKQQVASLWSNHSPSPRDGDRASPTGESFSTAVA